MRIKHVEDASPLEGLVQAGEVVQGVCIGEEQVDCVGEKASSVVKLLADSERSNVRALLVVPLPKRLKRFLFEMLPSFASS